MAELQSTDEQLPAHESAARDAADRLRLLMEFVAARDVTCPRCGYNLRMMQADVCTECGTQVVLGIHAAEPIMRAWIAAMVGASLGAGIGLLFLMLVVGKAGMPPREWWWLLLLSWVDMPITVLLVLKRRAFLRWGSGGQWACAVALGFALAAILIGLANSR